MKRDLLSALFAELGRLRDLDRVERELQRRGYRLVAGVDEAGRGALAGPVVAAAVILPPGCVLMGVDDSKRLDSDCRERLARAIRAHAIAVGVGVVSAAEIDLRDILRASLEAMPASVAAASIVAKVERDRMVRDLGRRFPAYGFEQHKGYGTPEHWQALTVNGPCPEHRLSFHGVVAGSDPPIVRTSVRQ